VATAPILESTYPGGSKSRVSRAGAAVRRGDPSSEDLAVIDIWRAAHRPVLNTFQAILRIRARGANIVVAQRHKRKRTIFDKLNRLPRMELARMDDIAGCRLIFPTIEDLYAFRVKVHAARFKHKRRMKEINTTISKPQKKPGIVASTTYTSTTLILNTAGIIRGYLSNYSTGHLFSTHGLLRLK
jgi:hypothetical protein